LSFVITNKLKIQEMNKMKKIINKNSFRFVILLLFIFLNVSVHAQGRDIQNELRDFYETKYNYKQDVYQRTLKFIQENPNASGLPTLYFNVAELSVEIDREDISKTIHYYQKVLELDPNFPNKDIVLYNIGYFSFLDVVNKRNEARYKNLDKVMNWPDDLRLSEDKLQVSINSYTEVMNEFPLSIYHTEAIYRLGTIYFEIATDSRNPMQFYPNAIDYFNRVVQKEDDPLYTFGLFQRGWAYFSSGNFDLAIDDFSKIITVLKNDTTKRAFFEADAIENIAFSLIEKDGTDFVQKSAAADKAKELLRNFVSPEYARKVLLKAIELKLTYSAPMQAIDLYNTYIDLYPLSLEVPTYMDSIITIYKRYSNRTRNNEDARDQIVLQKIRITDQFTPDSEWFKVNKDKPIQQQMGIIREAYEFVETRYHNQFVQSPTFENYEVYRKLVDNYVNFKMFTDIAALEKIESMRKRIVDNSLHYATLSDNPSLYFTAINYIRNYNTEYPEHTNQAQYREDIFYCYEQVYSLLKDKIVETSFVDSLNQIELTKKELENVFINATVDYENLLVSDKYTKPNKNDELIRITYHRADIYYNREDYDLAYQNFQKLLTYQLTAPLYKTTYSILAEISEMKGDFYASEQNYRNAIKYASKDEQKDFENNILASIRLAADSMLNSEDYQKAADEYLRLSKELESTNQEQSISYIMQAIDVYKKTGNHEKAEELFMQIAKKKTDIREVLAAYTGAWSIADSLKNWQKSESLRNQFVSRFPASNEAYNLRLKMIDWYENEPFKDKNKAAQMYLTLHDDAKNMDIGADKRESLFIKAIQLYQQINNETRYIELINQFAKVYPYHEATQELLRNVAITHNNNKNVEAMLAFEKQYPNHPYSMELLKSVARIYNENKQTDKFEDIARYIYKKDPSIDLLTDIALGKIKDKYDQIDLAFRDKNYKEMRQRITEFKSLDKKYQADGISLPLTTMYDRFNYYEKHIDYYDRFDKKILFTENNIIKATPNTLLRVNADTEFKKHLDGGTERIKVLMRTCDTAQKDIIALVQEGAEFSLNTEQRTKALYVVAKSYDYSHEVVLAQIQLFINVATQLNNPVMNENPVQQKTFKDQIKAYGNVKASEFLKKAAQWYQTLLVQFYDDKDYSDEWTKLALARLVELGVRSEKEEISIFADQNWKINKQSITRYETAMAQESVWSKPDIVSGNFFIEKGNILKLNDFVTYIPAQYNAEIRPEALVINYVATGKTVVTVNDMPIDREPIIVDTLIINEKEYTHYKIAIGRNLRKGLNDILFIHEPIGSSEQYFSAKITGQFDIEQLKFHRTTEEHYLYTDYSWVSKTGNVSITNLNLDNTWKSVSKSNFSFFKPQMFNMENTGALDIWHSSIDTTKVTTVFFAKEINIPAKIHQATIRFIGEKTTTIWINEEKVIDNYEVVYDTRLSKVDSHSLSVNQLKEGKNTIVARVNGDVKYKGFILEMHYITDKSDRVGAVKLPSPAYVSEVQQKKDNESDAITDALEENSTNQLKE
jgi:tetratricopeptide (TPR) repeat protein